MLVFAGILGFLLGYLTFHVLDRSLGHVLSSAGPGLRPVRPSCACALPTSSVSRIIIDLDTPTHSGLRYDLGQVLGADVGFYGTLLIALLCLFLHALDLSPGHVGPMVDCGLASLSTTLCLRTANHLCVLDMYRLLDSCDGC